MSSSIEKTISDEVIRKLNLVCSLPAPMLDCHVKTYTP